MCEEKMQVLGCWSFIFRQKVSIMYEVIVAGCEISLKPK